GREAREPRVVRERLSQAVDQRAFERGEIERALTAVDADALTAVAHLAGVAGGAAEAGPGLAACVDGLREADRERLRVGRRGGLHEEAERVHVRVGHEAFGLAGLLQRLEPCGRDQARTERGEPGARLHLAAPALFEVDRAVAAGYRRAVDDRLGWRAAACSQCEAERKRRRMQRLHPRPLGRTGLLSCRESASASRRYMA